MEGNPVEDSPPNPNSVPSSESVESDVPKLCPEIPILPSIPNAELQILTIEDDAISPTVVVESSVIEEPSFKEDNGEKEVVQADVAMMKKHSHEEENIEEEAPKMEDGPPIVTDPTRECSADDTRIEDKGDRTAEQTAVVADNASSSYNNENHPLKEIEFGGIRMRIVTQNENGPCPLVAVLNALILTGRVSYNSLWSVARSRMLDTIADCLLSNRPSHLAVDSNYDQVLMDVINILPTCVRGLDVNVRFSGVRQFEYTPALALFDLLNMNLYHGWIVEGDEMKRVIGDSSYNEVSLRATASDANALLYEEFLLTTASQLTTEGLLMVLDAMAEGEIAVLFRNNHFHCMCKRDDKLFLLVTDHGYLRHPRVVWECVHNIENDSFFVDGFFRPYDSPPIDVQTKQDHELALQMQMEEEARAREEAEADAKQRNTNVRTELRTEQQQQQEPSERTKKDKCSIS